MYIGKSDVIFKDFVYILYIIIDQSSAYIQFK